LFILIFTFSGMLYGAGYLVNFNEIGGSYSGIIYGFASTISVGASILAPFLVGVLTENVIFYNFFLNI
jgi:hypothetical protein